MPIAEHPLKQSEETFFARDLEQKLQMWRHREGLAAPMRVMMEMQAYKRVGRLPFLSSSRVHMDVITGNDENIDFSTFLGTDEFSERLSTPQAVAERKANIH